jgi:hypothetical protein
MCFPVRSHLLALLSQFIDLKYSEILYAGTMPVIPELSSANRSGSRMARKWWRMTVPVAAGLPS